MMNAKICNINSIYFMITHQPNKYLDTIMDPKFTEISIHQTIN